MTISEPQTNHNVLAVAQNMVGKQSYPNACLYVVATPIGNLADMSLRALHILHIVDAIACEDTRHTQMLLRAWSIPRPPNDLVMLHQHNERQAAQKIVERLQAGQRIAYVSDAGTPTISDPGAILVHTVHAANLRVMPIPGASSITAALSASGASSKVYANGITGMENGWIFAGFLPTKEKKRQQAIQALYTEPRTVIMLETPHRIKQLCTQLAYLDQRCVTLARELTKQFETIATMPANALINWFEEDNKRSKGEFVIVIHPQAQTTNTTPNDSLTDEQQRILKLLLNELPMGSAARLASEITGVTRKYCYAQALLWQQI